MASKKKKNFSKETAKTTKSTFGRDITIFFLFCALFFVAMISFATVQQRSNLEANIAATLEASEVKFDYVGTESAPQLRKFYLIEAEGSEYIATVAQNNRTVLDIFNIEENPTIVETFQRDYHLNW